jgi:CDP-diacylglycerol--glycerol-3-phosphate 3-phosphatidyltransferase
MAGDDARPRGPGRTLGLRRGGPEPRATRAGEPLHPLTLPNMVSFARLGLLIAFLVLALDSGDGRTALATVFYGVAAAGDYLDGLLARVTGQYSRLGALIDPLIDRLVVICGVVVAWHFELLPHWALAVLVAREVFMLGVVLAALRIGLDIEINWTGRLAVWPTMAGLGLSLMLESSVANVCLYVGIAGSIAATALYVRDGLRKLR